MDSKKLVVERDLKNAIGWASGRRSTPRKLILIVRDIRKIIGK